jgi:FkbM family methyltransferase
MPNPTRIFTSGVSNLLRALLLRTPVGGRAWLARQLMRDRYDPATRAMADFCQQALHAWHNRQFAVEQNGESAMLARLRPFRPTTLIDVGANIGDWSVVACQALPEATVHAFEISERTARDLVRCIAPYPGRVVINTVGLGEAEGEVAFYMTPENNTAASTVRAALQVAMEQQGLSEVQEIRARITTGDAYLRQAGIERVDVLKIDVEGAEFSVLRGFAEAFGRRAIDLVQFEYGAINLSTRDFLADFYHFFKERGFAIGKLYPEGVAFKAYEIGDEDFIGPNYIACRMDRPDIIETLRCPVLRVAGR